MFSDYRAVIISEYKTFFLTFSIILYNNDEDLFNVLFSNFKSLLNILIFDSFVVVVASGISYRGNVLAFLAAIITLRSSSYLILCSRYYFIFYF